MTRASTLCLAILLLPGALAAQQGTVSVRVTTRSETLISREEVRAWYTEMQQIAARIQAAHARALRDARLRRGRDSLATAIQRAMDEADPALPQLAGRAAALEDEARQARAGGNEGMLLDLMREANRIQARFQAARARAIREATLAARIRQYELRLRAALLRQDPQLDSLLQRGTELQARLGRVAEIQQMLLEERVASPSPP